MAQRNSTARFAEAWILWQGQIRRYDIAVDGLVSLQLKSLSSDWYLTIACSSMRPPKSSAWSG